MHGPIDSVYRQIRRNRIVEVRFIEGMDAGVSIIRSSPHLRGLDMEGMKLTAELETDDEGLAELLDELIRQGVRIKSFNDKDPTLEDVFMLVTKGLVA
jgi:ABC-2 type transport system ATP-binding protein